MVNRPPRAPTASITGPASAVPSEVPRLIEVDIQVRPSVSFAGETDFWMMTLTFVIVGAQVSPVMRMTTAIVQTLNARGKRLMPTAIAITPIVKSCQVGRLHVRAPYTRAAVSDPMEKRARRMPPSAGVPSSSVKLTIDTSIAPNVMPMPM